MPCRKASSRRKRSVNRRLLDGLIPKKSAIQSTPVMIDLLSDSSQSQSVNKTVTTSSSMLKVHEEEVKKDPKSSPDPTLPSRQQQQQHCLQVRRSLLFHINFDQIVSLLCKVPLHQQPVTAAMTTTNSSSFFYSPMYRRYFALTPPNPRLNNSRLLEDYIDWYINVYMEEELPWQWVGDKETAFIHNMLTLRFVVLQSIDQCRYYSRESQTSTGRSKEASFYSVNHTGQAIATHQIDLRIKWFIIEKTFCFFLVVLDFYLI
jgi:hypothetical protein